MSGDTEQTLTPGDSQREPLVFTADIQTGIGLPSTGVTVLS
jgi:hypothetical protein